MEQIKLLARICERRGKHIEVVREGGGNRWVVCWLCGAVLRREEEAA